MERTVSITGSPHDSWALRKDHAGMWQLVLGGVRPRDHTRPGSPLKPGFVPGAA